MKRAQTIPALLAAILLVLCLSAVQAHADNVNPYEMSDVTRTFVSIDSTTATNTSTQGKLLLLVFYRDDGTCLASNQTIENLAAADFVKDGLVEVYAVPIIDGTKDTVTAYAAAHASGSKIHFCYNQTAEEGSRYFWSYERRLGRSGTVAVPLSVVIDRAGQIRNCFDGTTTAVEFRRSFAALDSAIPYAWPVPMILKGTADYDSANEVLTIVNARRQENGLQPLTMDADLLSAATQRGAEIKLYFSHTRPDGRSCFTVTDALGGYAGENIAYNQASAEEVMTAWMNSAGHKANILDADFTRIGIGCFYQEDGSRCWVQTFSDGTAKPSSASGVSPVACNVLLSPDYVTGSWISAASDEVELNDTLPLTLNVETDSGWAAIDVCGLDFTVSDPAVAAMSPCGGLYGIRPGSVGITISYPSLTSAHRTFTVSDVWSGNRVAAPSLSVSADAATGKLILSWNAVLGATGYEVYYNDGADGSYVRYGATTDTSLTLASVSANQTFRYKVRALGGDARANSSFSNTVSRTCDCARPVVTASNYAATGKIRLAWNAVPGAVRYDGYYSTNQNGTYTKFTYSTEPVMSVGFAKPGETYYFKIIAIGSSSAANSAFSVPVLRTADCAQPAVTVSNYAATGKIRLAWDAVPGAVRYDGYYSTSQNGTYTKFTYSTEPVMSVGFAKPGETYYFKVIAIGSKASANSAFSVPVLRTADCAQPVVTASNYAATGKIRLAWDTVPGAVRYDGYYSTSQNGTYTKFTYSTEPVMSVGFAKPGETYYFKIIAIGSSSAANSAFSVPVARTAG